MVAYSFKSQFREPILALTKQQTIRTDRKRQARSGEQLQLYTGMRTRHCALIAKAVCLDCLPIRIGIAKHWIEIEGRRIDTRVELNLFASFDGFRDWSSMHAFWKAEHPGLRIFSGWAIRLGRLASRVEGGLRCTGLI